MDLGSAKPSFIYSAFQFSNVLKPWNWIWNLQDPTSIEYPDGKQIQEPYLQVFAFLLSGFTDKIWDLKWFWKCATPTSSCYRLIFSLMPQEIGKSVWPLEDQTNPFVKAPLPWCLLFPRLSFGGSRAKHPLSCKHMYCWVKTNQNPLGKSVSHVIQSDIAWVWLIKHVQDKGPAAVQKFEKFAAPHVSRVNIDIDE